MNTVGDLYSGKLEEAPRSYYQITYSGRSENNLTPFHFLTKLEKWKGFKRR